MFLPVEVWERALAFVPEEDARTLAREEWETDLDRVFQRLELSRMRREFVKLEDSVRNQQVDFDSDLQPDSNCDVCTTDLLDYEYWSCSLLEHDFCDECWQEEPKIPAAETLLLFATENTKLLANCKLCGLRGSHAMTVRALCGYGAEWQSYNTRSGRACDRCYQDRARWVSYFRVGRIQLSPGIDVSTHVSPPAGRSVLVDVSSPFGEEGCRPFALGDYEKLSTEITSTRLDAWAQALAEIWHWDFELGKFLAWAPISDALRVPQLDYVSKKGRALAKWVVVLVGWSGVREGGQPKFAFASWVQSDHLPCRERYRVVVAEATAPYISNHSEFVRQTVEANLTIL